jgi:hypothetical protein
VLMNELRSQGSSAEGFLKPRRVQMSYLATPKTEISMLLLHRSRSRLQDTLISSLRKLHAAE